MLGRTVDHGTNSPESDAEHDKAEAYVSTTVKLSEAHYLGIAIVGYNAFVVALLTRQEHATQCSVPLMWRETGISSDQTI